MLDLLDDALGRFAPLGTSRGVPSTRHTLEKGETMFYAKFKNSELWGFRKKCDRDALCEGWSDSWTAISRDRARRRFPDAFKNGGFIETPSGAFVHNYDINH